MTISERSGRNPVLDARAASVQVSEDVLNVRLEDGRSILVPIAWFPRLLNGDAEQRSQWEIIGGGIGIHWPDLDEDISVESLLATRGEDLLIYHAEPTPTAAKAAPAKSPKIAKVVTSPIQTAASRAHT